MLKKTAFYDMHVQNKGKIVPFAGFEMPVQFKGVIDEIKRVRSTVGVFDVSHMGEFIVTGDRRKEFVDFITTNSVMSLADHQVQYSNFLYENGGIVDDLLVYNLKDKIMLVVNASNCDKDFDWVMKNKWDDVKVENISDRISQLAVQGPSAERVIKKLTDYPLDTMPFYYSAETKVCGIDMVISRTGYTGEDGFELYFYNENGKKMWEEIFKAGEEFNIEPIGLAARDTLRLEMKYMLYGNDISQDTTPLEAGTGWAVKMEKGDFIGRDALIKQKEAGLTRKLVCFEMLEKAIPRHGYEIFVNDKKVGNVTSGNFSPSTDKYIGLGYVDAPFNKLGQDIFIDIRGKKKAVIVKSPFYKNGTHK